MMNASYKINTIVLSIYSILIISSILVLSPSTAFAQSRPTSIGSIDSDDNPEKPFIPVAEEISLEDEHPVDDFLVEDDTNTDNESSSIFDSFNDNNGLKLPNPLYEIHNIRVSGNIQTSSERILSIMNIQKGNLIRLDDLEEGRIRLAVSGAFESVEVNLHSIDSKKLDIQIDVTERSNIQINNYWIGTSDKSPFWMGLDVTWLAPFSQPHRLRWAFAATSADDYSLDISYLIPTIAHKPVSLLFEIQSMHSHEGIYAPSRLINHTLDNSYDHIYDLNFKRHGISAGIGYSPKEYLRFLFKFNYSYLHRLDNTDLVNHEHPVDSFMKAGRTHMPNLSFITSYDNRTKRELPDSGHFVALAIRGTFKSALSDYHFIRANIFHQSNFNIYNHHIIRLNSFAGVHYGNAPFFERFFYNDFYTFSPSRFLMLNPSSKGAMDLFKTGSSSLSYEDFLASFAVTYAWQPSRYHLELFVTASVTWADSLKDEPLAIGVQPVYKRGDFPIDMSFNGGVRIVTPYGLVSLTLAHFLNLIPR